MKKIIVLVIVVTLSSLYGYESKIQILKGSEHQICKDYADNMNLQFAGERGWEFNAIYKFREFKSGYEKKFTRPYWKEIKKGANAANFTLTKRLIGYRWNLYSINENQYENDNYKNFDFARIAQWFFYKDFVDIDFDGKKETIARIYSIAPAYPPNKPGYSERFTIYMVVVDEKNQSVDVSKSKILKQSFASKNINNPPYDDVKTDTNLFFYNKKIYIDTFWRKTYPPAPSGFFEPRLKITEITKDGQKDICSFKIMIKN